MEIPYSFETLIEFEQKRQNDNIELIASENFCSERVRNACGSILTNKYAEGYPRKRYYGGCSFIDLIEQKAINNACELFNCKFANVQPHCGSSANQAVYRALLKPGDTVLAMDLGAGGHLTHGHKLSFSGQDYNIVSYGVDDNGVINYKDIEEKLFTINPQMILVGASSYSQIIDFERIARMIEDYYNVNGERPFYFVDMAHIAGLVAAGVHPSPFPWADVVTTTTHKTLRGPRGGLILWNKEEYTNKINKAVFPGIQGGPLEHIIAAKGICFEEALQPEFKEYAKQIISNTKVFADEFIKLGAKVISGGTQNHLFVLDVYSSYGITGKDAEDLLDGIKITVNKNQIPNDTLSPLVSSGIRIGTPAMTTKGWTEDKFRVLANIIDKYLKNHDSETFNKELAEKEVERLIKDDEEVEDLITHDDLEKTLFYVFLDIDGVLNNERHISKCYDMNGHHAMHMNHVPFDPDCLDNLMKLVRFLEEKHEVRIVLSSTWRLHVIDKEIVEARLAEYGLKIHSVTPYKHAERGLEIKQYLEDNDRASGIIIIDDDKEDIVPYYPVHLVKTDFYSGLDSGVVKRAKFKYMEGDLWI